MPHLHFLFESSDDPLHSLIYKFYGRRCEFLYKRKGSEFKNVYKGKVISEHSNSLNFYFMDDCRIKGATVESLKNFKEMRKEFNLLFKAYRQEKNSSEVINVIAEIHWLFANVAPYSRGSAAIGDAICRALLEAKGIRTSRWKANIIQGCEALTLPLEKFKKRYASFFENELKETFDHVG